MDNLDNTNADRLTLLDRLAERCPDLDRQAIEWMTLEDGHERCSSTAAGSTVAAASTSPTRATTSTRSGVS